MLLVGWTGGRGLKGLGLLHAALLLKPQHITNRKEEIVFIILKMLAICIYKV
jgi:hypothetical protein